MVAVVDLVKYKLDALYCNNIKASSNSLTCLRRLLPKEETVIKLQLSPVSNPIITEPIRGVKVQAHGKCMTFILYPISILLLDHLYAVFQKTSQRNTPDNTQ